MLSKEKEENNKYLRPHGKLLTPLSLLLYFLHDWLAFTFIASPAWNLPPALISVGWAKQKDKYRNHTQLDKHMTMLGLWPTADFTIQSICKNTEAKAPPFSEACSCKPALTLPDLPADLNQHIWQIYIRTEQHHKKHKINCQLILALK